MSYLDEPSLIMVLLATLLTLVPIPLTIVFSVLKLAGEISWSWVWVLSPFWGAYGLLVVLVILTMVLVAILSAR